MLYHLGCSASKSPQWELLRYLQFATWGDPLYIKRNCSYLFGVEIAVSS